VEVVVMPGRWVPARTAVALVVVLLTFVALAAPAAAQTVGTLSGRLVTPEGAPAPFVLVVVYDESGTQPQAATFTRWTGRFSVSGLNTEEHAVRVVGGLRFESGWVSCSSTVVKTYGDACTFSLTDLGDIVVQRR
jgi:hypothetical protein